MQMPVWVRSGGSSRVSQPGPELQSQLSPLLAGPVKLLTLPGPPRPHLSSEDNNRTYGMVGGFEGKTLQALGAVSGTY